jgi:ubiquinone/menaquinone biosynthesis C-methylase UbiE
MSSYEAREDYMKHGMRSEDDYHASRTAVQHAAFFLPHLKPGMRLIDCGCGPGSITVGLAEHVAPGEVVGIDVDESALARAQETAARRGVDNVRFESGSVYKLPFADESFDAAFMHALLEHLGDPVAALKELLRVLVPAGIVGVRTPDFDGFLLAPAIPEHEEWFRIALHQHAKTGGSMYRGKHLRRLLREAGYIGVQASAAYEIYATPEATRERAAQQIGEDSLSGRLLQQGVIDEGKKAQLDEGWRKWAEDPDAFLAIAWGQAVGWKAV